MKTIMILLVAMAAVLVITLTPIIRSQAASTIQLPDDFKVVPPDPSLSEGIKALSGKWTGEWVSSRGSPIPAMLVVEEIISETNTIIVHSVATSRWSEGIWQRHKAEIWTKGKKVGIFFRAENGRKIEFTLKDNGSLSGEAVFGSPRGDITSSIVMKRVP